MTRFILTASCALLLAACGGGRDVAPPMANIVPMPDPAASTSQARSVEAGINANRTAAGLKPLAHSGQLAAAAAAHARDMATRGYFDHIAPDGSTPAQRVKAQGYRSCLTAENIARGQPDAAAVVTTWMNSPGHRANNLNRKVTQIGAARADGPTWVVVLARPC